MIYKAEELKTKFTSEMKTNYNEQTEISDRNGDSVFEEEAVMQNRRGAL